jgi:hypothetical protein
VIKTNQAQDALNCSKEFSGDHMKVVQGSIGLQVTFHLWGLGRNGDSNLFGGQKESF